jgi:hypothetical protein
MDDLVERLSERDHRVEVTLRPDRTAQALKERIDDGFVHIKFTETRGGTELGVSLDPAASDISGGEFDAGRGRITLAGSLTLNYVPVRCTASIDLATLSGTGRLHVLATTA